MNKMNKYLHDSFRLLDIWSAWCSVGHRSTMDVWINESSMTNHEPINESNQTKVFTFRCVWVTKDSPQTVRMINIYIFYVKKIEFHTKKYIQGSFTSMELNKNHLHSSLFLRISFWLFGKKRRFRSSSQDRQEMRLRKISASFLKDCWIWSLLQSPGPHHPSRNPRQETESVCRTLSAAAPRCRYGCRPWAVRGSRTILEVPEQHNTSGTTWRYCSASWDLIRAVNILHVGRSWMWRQLTLIKMFSC